MPAFRYQYGDRPLEGYTIQRAVGRGGFGEVYYAVSDSGREVALKIIQNYEQIELRGVGQCMNLKSPHLVSIFDVKHNADGLPFVIMEYVAGPSLRELLDESPAGLGPQKTAFFLREIAKGLTFLHDRGIVHRDLKPGNIFYEDGYVKIGDYGLSKAISESQCSGQTITVGTVHYMAPEIGQGRYDKSIDIYALGVVLYEMLTGQTPYLGATPTEVLMKHLMSEPGVSGIEEPFATVIRKAMAKDPEQRYQSAQEMVEAIFGAEHVRNSVSHFRPESLSVAAERIAQKVALPGTGSSGEARLPGGGGPAVATGSSGPGGPAVPTPPRIGREESWEEYGRRMGQWGEEVGRRWGEWGERFGERMAAKGEQVRDRIAERRDQIRDRLARREGRSGPAAQYANAGCDPLDWNQRRLLGITTAALMGAGTALVAESEKGNPLWIAMFAFVVIASAAGGIVGAGQKFLPSLEGESEFVRRVVVTGIAGLCSLLAFPYLVAASGGANLSSFIGAFVAAGVFGVVYQIKKQRAQGAAAPGIAAAGRLIYLGPMLIAAMLPCLGLMPGSRSGSLSSRLGTTLLCVGAAIFLVCWRRLVAGGREERVSLGSVLWPGFLGWMAAQIFHGDAMLAGGIMAGVSLVVQVTSPFEPPALRRKRELLAMGQGAAATGGVVVGAGGNPAGAGYGQAAPPTAPMGGSGERRRGAPVLVASDAQPLRPVPNAVTAICLGLFVLFAGIGILLLSWIGLANMNEREATFFGLLGVASLFSAFVCLIRGVRRTYHSAWSGFFRPLLMLGCVLVIFTAAAFMATARLRDEEMLIPLAFVIFPGLLLFVLVFLPERTVTRAFGGRHFDSSALPSRRRRFPALVLAAVGFLGIAGLHRFYAGRIITGILWLLTGGLLGVGTLIDIILLLTGSFRDDEGRRLLIWDREDEQREWSTEHYPVIVPPRREERAAVAAGVAKEAAATPPVATPPAAILTAEMPTARDPQLESGFDIGRVTRAVVATVGGLLMLTGLLVGLLAAMRFPALLAAGWPDPSVARDLGEFFGSSEWPAGAQVAGELASIGLMITATLLIVIARRRSGAHMARGVFGCLALILSCQAVKAVFAPIDWSARPFSITMNALFRSIQDQPYGFSFLVLFLGGMVALIWAERPKLKKRNDQPV